MNGSTENRAHGASETPERRESALNLGTARRMLPLVQRIASDILKNQQNLTKLAPEMDRMERQRRDLSWPERSRRYRVQEEAATAERYYHDAVQELAGLGLALLDAEEAKIGFPTVVNGRKAFFCWRPGEEGVDFWQFPEDTVRRPIPASWAKLANLALSVKS